MQLLGEGQRQGQSATTGNPGQQEGMGEAALFGMPRQPRGQSFLADGHPFRSHGPKIAAIMPRGATGFRPSGRGPLR